MTVTAFVTGLAIRLALAAVAGALILAAGRLFRREGLITPVLLAASAASLALLAVVIVNRIGFPLNLDLMESTVLQHVRLAASLQPVYPAPGPDYVPLAYNPLYYYLSVPFTWVLGSTLPTLRLVAVLGYLGSGILVFAAVRQIAGSRQIAFIAAGLFAAAYWAMDSYLDTAHSDSWLLCSTLLGTWLIATNRSWGRDLLGVAVLVAAFWFKQHGAWFVLGGVLVLTVRHGLRRALPFWGLAAVFGPGVYLLLGPALFGSHFHYFTFEVPAAWQYFGVSPVRRYVVYLVSFFLFLAAGSLYALGSRLVREPRRLDVWHVQLCFAAFAALTGVMDTGSSNNIFIPLAAWLVLTGTPGLYELAARAAGWLAPRWPSVRAGTLAGLAVLASFGLLLYDPRQVMVSPAARASFDDLVVMLDGLGGKVYAPALGQLPEGYRFHPAAHWVALEDMIRGPGHAGLEPAVLLPYLAPLSDPNEPGFILENVPIETRWFFEPLWPKVVLVRDLGDRFAALDVAASRFSHGWPRYLYRYTAAPQTAARAAPEGGADLRR